MSITYQPGNWVWIHDDEERYLPARVKKQFKKGDSGVVVMTEDGENLRQS